MKRLWLDLETYSEVPIAHGTHAYASEAQVMLFAFAFDDGPVQVIDCTAIDYSAALGQIREVLADADEVWAHNSHFDRTVLSYNGINTDPQRWRDTMAQALAHGLPGSLGTLCDILKVPTDQAKDAAGKQLIQLFCKPRPKNMHLRRATSATHPDEWAKFVEYAALDIEAMRAVQSKLPTWNFKGFELDLWHLDQRINDRGIAIDLDLVRGALATVDIAHEELAERTQEITEGDLASTTRGAGMIDYVLERFGIDMPNLQAASVEKMLEDSDLDPELRALLEIRLQATTTSVTKFKRLSHGVSSDGRLKGTLQFCGASRTGRWAGRLFQPQNLPRPTLSQSEIDIGIETIKAGTTDLVFDNVMQVTSACIRGAIVAPKDRKLVISDLSNIEGRVQAWLADERWKLQAFSDYDAGTGHDLYKLAYAKSFGVDPGSVDSDQRQVGKAQELALGFGGGVGAFVTFAQVYRIDLNTMAAQVLAAAPSWAVKDAESYHDWLAKNKPRGRLGLSRETFVACDTVKRGWRHAHPEIAAHWAELQAAAIRAIEHPSETFICRRLKVRRDGAWLRIGLPSGRALCYPKPQVLDNQITYLGMNQFNRKWQRIKSYGGKLFENACQAVARDVLAANMPAVESVGFDICLTVHDELITEAPDHSDYSWRRLADLMSTPPAWATGLPLAASGFETYRYRKD